MLKLFVGNIKFGATEEDLMNLFRDAGHLVSECRIMTERDTGRSRGFGFVTLADGGDLKRAIGDMNGTDFMGRALTVSEAKPLESRHSNGNGHRDHGGRGRREPRW